MPFKIIFMDCNMPIMDGFTTSQQIVQTCKLNNCELPNIIALTANEPTEELLMKCTQSGMQEVMMKPPNINSLLNLFVKHGIPIQIKTENEEMQEQ